MNQWENEIKKWLVIFEKNLIFKKELNKLLKTGEEKNKTFFNSLNVMDNSIFGNYAPGYNNINAITLKKIMDLFIKIGFKNEDKKNNYFLISSDGHKDCVEIIKNVISFSNYEDIKLATFSNFEGFDKKFIASTIKKINPIGTLHISRSIYNSKILNVNLYDHNGIKMNNIFLREIVKKVQNHVDDIAINENSTISFLNNESLIKSFVDRVSSLFPKTKAKKKTKIAISNRSNGITRILARLFGNQDFSYVINNGVKKDIDIFDKKHINNYTIKKYFYKEILFAKLKKCDFLVCFNKEGSQSFFFLINGLRAIYLNENIMSLAFLHSFYADLSLNNKKALLNFFIASSEDPSYNILNIMKKYWISFKKIKNNNFENEKDYMLLFWNSYNQFVFGEKINNEFTIYHLLIKILSIVNYFKNQYNYVFALINKLETIYEEFEIFDKWIFDISNEKIKNKLRIFFENNRKNITNIKFDEKEELDLFEKRICYFETINNYRITFNYNEYMKKIVVKIRRKRHENLFSDWYINFNTKRNIIKKITKIKD